MKFLLFRQNHTIYRTVAAMLAIVTALSALGIYIYTPASRASAFSVVILSKYRATLKIGDTTRLIGIASNGRTVKWRSSKSSVASVNTYGLVTAKKAGSCLITARVSGGEASCRVTVRKTEIRLNRNTVTMENEMRFQLKATTSNNSEVTWKSSKSSVVRVEDDGWIYAEKVGTAVITARADGTKKTCKVKVKKPKVELNRMSLTMAPGETFQMRARVSSRRTPEWKSRRASVASIDDSGMVTAIKKGVTVISCQVDGTRKQCRLTVIEK